MSKRIMAILREKSGISLIFVLCFTLLLMTIGTSVLVSAANTASAARAREDSVVRERYAKEFAEYFSREVVAKSFPVDDNAPATPPVLPDVKNPFVAIAQEIYDKNKGNATVESIGSSRLADLTISDPNMVEGMKMEMAVSLSDEKVKILFPYQPEIKFDEGEAVPEIPEVAEVTAKMEIKFTATYKEKQYTVYANFALDGRIEGITRDDVNIVNTPYKTFSEGEWAILGYGN